MDSTRKKEFVGFGFLVVVLAALITILFFMSPEEIVNKLGAHNVYLIVFLVSFFGGFSAGGSATFISVLITFTLGGVNPLLLGIVSGISLVMGDLIMFYAGFKGRKLLKGKWDKRFGKMSEFIKKRKWLRNIFPFFAFIYIGLMPFPNDIMILFLAAIKYPLKKVMLILALADMTFPLMVTFLTLKGIVLFA